MDWKGISATVIGAIILGWLSYVTSSVGEAKHERDEMRKDIYYVKVDVEENKDGIEHIWSYNDAKAEVEVETLLELKEAAHKNEIGILNLKIEMLQDGK